MADERLQVILELVTGQYKREAREAATATDTIGKRAKDTGVETGRMTTQMGPAGAAMRGVALAGAAIAGVALVGFLKDATQAAAEDEQSQRLLALALQNTVGASQDSIAATEDWIDEMARATGVADDQLRPALANLVRAHGDEKRAQDDLVVAMDIATARGLSVEAVTLAMSKAALGNVGALGRLGLATKDAEGKTLTYDEVLKEAARTMGGATAAAADTAEGKMRRLGVAFDETKEAVGARLIPILLALGDTVLGVFDDLEREGDQNFLDAIITDIIEFEDKANNPVIWGIIDSFRFWGETLGIIDEKLPPVTSKTAELSSAMDAARHPTREMRSAVDELGAEAEETTEVLQTYTDKLRAISDPAFAAVTASRDLATAQAEYNTAVAEFGPSSAEAVAAAEDLIGADIDLKEAQQGLIDAGPGFRSQFVEMATQMGIPLETINAIIARLEVLETIKIGDKTFNVNARGNVGMGSGGFGFPGKAGGGPVDAWGAYTVGENGPETLLMGSRPGVIIPNRTVRHGDYTVIVQGNVDAQTLGTMNLYAGIQRRIETRR